MTMESLPAVQQAGSDDWATWQQKIELLFDPVIEQMGSCRKTELEGQFRLAERLNETLGSLAVPRRFRKEVIRLLCKRLGISKRDLSLMRRVAEDVTSVEEFQVSHPGVSSWEAVKELYRGARKPGGNVSSTVVRRQHSAAYYSRAFLRAAMTLTNRIDPQEAQGLFELISDVVMTAGSRAGCQWSVTVS